MGLSLSSVAVCFGASSDPTGTPSAQKKLAPSRQQETYQDLIQKAQNLTLQRDRLQASQILNRAIAREPKTSQGFKELTKALQDLTTVFYTERAQAAFVAGEANLPLKPKEAIDSFQEALRLEDGNVAVLKALARVYLVQGECEKADGYIKSAEALDSYSPEVLLLRLQAWDCSQATSFLDEKAFSPEAQAPLIENSVRGLQMKIHLRKSEFKKAKALLDKWSAAAKDYPEVSYWMFELSRAQGASSGTGAGTPNHSVDRAAAQRYVQLCQNLTPRKRKSFNLDVDLCKAKEVVESFLKGASDED